MRTKIITNWWSTQLLADQINAALSDLEANGYKIINVQYTSPFFVYTAMIVYK